MSGRNHKPGRVEAESIISKATGRIRQMLADTGGVFESGDLKTSARVSVPSGWLDTDGATYLIADYPELYEAIGTGYGGNGTTNFRVPDFRGRAIVGAGKGDNLTQRSRGDTFGTESVTLDTSQMPTHGHGGATSSSGSHQHGIDFTGAMNSPTSGSAPRVAGTGGDFTGGQTNLNGAHTHTITEAGGGGSHPNSQPSGVARVFIKT